MNPPQRHSEPVAILLVDDNQHGLTARKTLLQQIGHKAAIAQSGEEALKLMAQTSFDVVVTDFKMPRMNGTELITRIRAVEPKMRVILLSGFVDPLGLTEENTGADVVIAKSAGEVGHLVRAVDRLMRRRTPPKPARSEGSTLARRNKVR
jgi:CheY-like chemotaxis protein